MENRVDLSTFIPAVAFGIGGELDESVMSDHSLIGCKIEYFDLTPIKIGAQNISNKEYHRFFKTNKGPFCSTHLADDNPSSPYLLDKMKKQMEQIKELISKFDIQVIIEGYYDFFMELDKMIRTPHQLISILNEPNHQFMGSPKNITGILVNTERVNVLKSGILHEKCMIPWVQIGYSDRVLLILGIHLQGCAEQFPVDSLKELNLTLRTMKKQFPTSDIIALGDFNTVPKNIRSILKDVTLLKPLYPTHINPRFEVAVYDSIVYNFHNSDADIEPVSLDFIPADSQAFVRCLEQQCIWHTRRSV